MDESQYYCLCGCHVLTGARVIGYVGAVFGSILSGHALLTLNPGMVLVGLICIAISVALVYAHKTNNPNLYLPYLVVSGVGIFFLAVLLLVTVIMLVLMPTQWQDQMYALRRECLFQSKTELVNAYEAISSVQNMSEDRRYRRDSEFLVENLQIPSKQQKSLFGSAKQVSMIKERRKSSTRNGEVSTEQNATSKSQDTSKSTSRKSKSPNKAPFAYFSSIEKVPKGGLEIEEQEDGKEEPRKRRVEKTASLEQDQEQSSESDGNSTKSITNETVLETLADEKSKAHRIHGARMTTIFLLLVLLLIEALSVWFQSIVYRAYMYMRQDEILVIPPPTDLIIEKSIAEDQE